MDSSSSGGNRPSTVSKKRPLARRSCLKCREKKARCELPDLYVDSSRTPLPDGKRCHRCNVLNIQCIVWDGDRKRKPKLDRKGSSTASSAAEYNTAPAARGSSNASHALDTLVSTDSVETGLVTSRRPTTLYTGEAPGREDTVQKAAPNADGEQLGASEVSQAQRMLLNRQKGWKNMARTLFTLVERLQKERTYSKYLDLRIDAPPSTPDIVNFLHPAKLQQLETELQSYLVGHPYLPSLSALHQEHRRNATGPRALLLATMTLLALRRLEDPLASPECRSVSAYVDRLGTQMLLSAPRDIHLVMAFELLLAHEPGLVGTAASQYQPEARGLGLASENLLTCSIKIARELKLDEIDEASQVSAAAMSNLSLWCCLRVWETLYSFVGRSILALEGLDTRYSARVRDLLHSVDDEGCKLPSPPRLSDPRGPTGGSYREMREFCSDMEKRLGRDGLLRSAGRTVISLRIQIACSLFDSLRSMKSTLSDSGLRLEERHTRIVDVHTQACDAIMQVRDGTHEQLGAFAGFRLVRLWEQVLHIECAFFCGLFSNYCTSALFTDKIDGTVEIDELTRSLLLRLGPAELIGKIGKFNVETSRAVLSSISQLDRQPVLRKADSPRQASPRFMHCLPTLLVSAVAVDAAKSCLESAAFVLVVWARPSHDIGIPVTLMEAASQRILQLAPRSSIEEATSIPHVAAGFIDEMVDTIRLWQLYYRVYRPQSHVPTKQSRDSNGDQAHPEAQTNAADAWTGYGNKDVDDQRTAMDYLASAAEAIQGTALSGAKQLPRQPCRGLVASATTAADNSDVSVFEDSSSSRTSVPNFQASFLTEPNLGDSQTAPAVALTSLGGHAVPVDDDVFSACMPFDLEAFLKDVDQLF